MNVGKFNQSITIQSYSETESANGGVARGYSTYATTWAQVRPIGGAEGQQNSEKVANIVCEFTIRVGSLVLNETMRIVWRGKTFNITSIDEVGMMLNQAVKIRAIAKDNE